MNKLKILYTCIIGYWYKLLSKFVKLESLENDNNNLVISLTSYGRRISESLPYTLVSLLRQKIKPSKIVVWLDNAHDLETLPTKLKKFQKYGVEFRFCEDIRSYKKLIPSLKENPDSIIITVDDDVYYSPYLVSNLYEAYIREPEKIHCTVAHEPKFEEGKISNYSLWDNNVNTRKRKYLFPVGVGGVLYPPKSLDKEVLNEQLFIKLCPFADDIWFWIMAIRKGTEHNLVYMKHPFYNIDVLYQYFHRNSSLSDSNVIESGNNKQLSSVLSYYKIEF
jgi:hypothetical protein